MTRNLRKPGFSPSRYISASQISKFDVEDKPKTACQRRYAFQYIMGFPDPAGAAAELGGKVHAHLENFVAKGIPIPPGQAGRVAFSAMPYAKEVLRFDNVEVERKFQYVQDGVTYLGYVDVAWTHPAGFPAVRDWKTSSNPRAYGLTTGTMMVDPQAVLYARQALERHGADMVMLDWIYMTTRGATQPAYSVRAQFPKIAVDAAWSRVHALGQAIASLKADTELHANDLEPNWQACKAYGKPCPFIDQCDGARDPARIIGEMQDRLGDLIPAEDLAAMYAKQNKPQQQTQSQPQPKEASNMSILEQKLANRRRRQGRSTPVDTEAKKPEQKTPKTPETIAEPGPVEVLGVDKPHPESRGLDPDKARAAFEAKQEANKPETRPTRVNAPEAAGSEDEDAQAAMSEKLAAVTEKNPGKGKAKKARDTYAQVLAEQVAEGHDVESAHLAACKEAEIDPETCERITKTKGGSKGGSKTTAKKVAVEASHAWLECLRACSGDLEATDAAYKAWLSKFS